MSLRTRLDGNGLLVSAVGGLLLLGLVVVVLTFTGSTSTQWTGTRVHGVERGGIVYYSWAGKQYSIDDDNKYDSTTVAFRASDPGGTAMLINTNEHHVEEVGLALPFVAAAAVLVITLVRRRRKRAVLAAAPDDGFGRGLDHDVVQRLIEKRRKGL